MEIEVLAIDMYLGKQLAKEELEGEVHSVFSKACNIRTCRDELIVIAQAEKLNGPNYLLVNNTNDFLKLKIKEKSKVITSKDKFFFSNNLIFNFKTAVNWQLDYSREIITKEELRQKIRSLSQLTDFYREKSGFYLSGQKELFAEKILALKKHLLSKNLSAWQEDFGQFIGWGIGLTPSGDDFLAGLICAVHFLDKNLPCEFSNFFCRHISSVIKPLQKETTFISGKLLEYAVCGRTSQMIGDVLDHIWQGDFADISLERLLSFGSTSGIDTMLGIEQGFSLCWESLNYK